MNFLDVAEDGSITLENCIFKNLIFHNAILFDLTETVNVNI